MRQGVVKGGTRRSGTKINRILVAGAINHVKHGNVAPLVGEGKLPIPESGLVNATLRCLRNERLFCTHIKEQPFQEDFSFALVCNHYFALQLCSPRRIFHFCHDMDGLCFLICFDTCFGMGKASF